MSDTARNLGPYAINVFVQPLKRKRLQSRVRLRQEANKPSGGRHAHHLGIQLRLTTLELQARLLDVQGVDGGQGARTLKVRNRELCERGAEPYEGGDSKSLMVRSTKRTVEKQ